MEQKITTNEVKSDSPIDYDRLIDEFGSKRIDQNDLELLNQVIEKRQLSAKKEKYMHYFNNGIFFSHRDFTELLKNYLNGQSFYIYTGRGPSSISMHIGHLIPFQMAQILQELFDVIVVIQLTDDEKFYCDKQDRNLLDFTNMANENIKDIIACGFDSQKTFIFTNTGYIQHLFPTVIQIQKLINFNVAKAIFGVDNRSSLGKIAFPAMQIAPSFSICFPHLFPTNKPIQCLIPCAIDQDPYFRLTRDLAPRMKYLKPALLHAKFLPSLQGLNGKMSSSIPDSVIFLSDSSKIISKKIKKSFSGGGASIEEHKSRGANLDVDIPINYLNFFLTNREEYLKIKESYKKGEISTGEVKNRLIVIINDIIDDHKKIREIIKSDIIQMYMRI